MDENLQRLLGESARAARLQLGLTQAEVAKKVRLKSGVYGRVERGMMMPSVPTCGACARPWASPRMCSCPWFPSRRRGGLLMPDLWWLLRIERPGAFLPSLQRLPCFE
jgi:DNA-binding XRE family transcriptional regulator